MLMINLQNTLDYQKKPMRASIRKLLLFLVFYSVPWVVMAQWSMVKHKDIDTGEEVRVAYTENSEGYSLEVYRDKNDAIRSRFSINSHLGRLLEGQCPTFQVDNHEPINRSVNGALCIAHARWAEFVLGYANNNEVKSKLLNMLRNGDEIIYRFPLENGNYAETSFSLAGSRRTVENSLGKNLAYLF